MSNGTTRAAILIARDAFLARIIDAVAALGEVVTVTTTPHKGRPLTSFTTANGVSVPFTLYDAPNLTDGHWRINVDSGQYDKTWRRLDLVDVTPIAIIIVKPIKRQRAIARTTALMGRLNRTLPDVPSVRAGVNYNGGLALETLRPLTEAQVTAMLAAYVACCKAGT
jgi:hypothetical protein